MYFRSYWLRVMIDTLVGLVKVGCNVLLSSVSGFFFSWFSKLNFDASGPINWNQFVSIWIRAKIRSTIISQPWLSRILSKREGNFLKKKHFQTRFAHRLLSTFQTRQAFDFICFRKRIYFTFSLHVKIAFSHTDVCIDFSLVTMNWQRSHERWHARKQEYTLAASVTIVRICIF